MANNGGGGFNATSFIIGALVAAVVGFGAYYFGGFGKDEADIKVELPNVSN